MALGIEGLWRHTIFSRTSGIHVCSRDVSIYCMGLKMAAVEAVCFRPSCYQFGECFCHRNTVVVKKVYCPLDRLNRLFWLFRFYKCEIRQIIYGHPGAIAGKLRKLLDCEDVRRNMRAVVIDKTHLVVE